MLEVSITISRESLPTGQANFPIEEYAGVHSEGSVSDRGHGKDKGLDGWRSRNVLGRGGVRFGWRDICSEGLGFAW